MAKPGKKKKKPGDPLAGKLHVAGNTKAQQQKRLDILNAKVQMYLYKYMYWDWL